MSYRYVAGYCVPLFQCNELRFSKDFTVLRRSLCGFYGNEPKVCCPAQSNTGGNTGYPNNNNNNGYPNNNNNNGNYQPPVSSTQPPINEPDSEINANANVDFVYPRKLPQPCGISPKETTRVVGGSPAIPGKNKINFLAN